SIARPSTSWARWSSARSRTRRKGRSQRGERAQGERLRRPRRGRALGLRRGAERLERVRLLAPGILRNFDAGLADPAPGPYHRFSGQYYTHDMSEYARAPRVLVVEDDEDIAQ